MVTYSIQFLLFAASGATPPPPNTARICVDAPLAPSLPIVKSPNLVAVPPDAISCDSITGQ